MAFHYHADVRGARVKRTPNPLALPQKQPADGLGVHKITAETDAESA
jgi:hypothetical protein